MCLVLHVCIYIYIYICTQVCMDLYIIYDIPPGGEIRPLGLVFLLAGLTNVGFNGAADFSIGGNCLCRSAGRWNRCFLGPGGVKSKCSDLTVLGLILVER